MCRRSADPPVHYQQYGLLSECPVGIANVLRSIITNKTNVPADLHELLSTAKNLPEFLYDYCILWAYMSLKHI